MNGLGNGALVCKARANLTQNGFRNALRPAKLFEGQGGHIHDAKISHGKRAHPSKLGAEQRARHDYIETAVLHQIFRERDDFGCNLNFVEEDDGVARKEYGLIMPLNRKAKPVDLPLNRKLACRNNMTT